MPSDRVDVYFSADVETDGPIPGPYSMLSFGLCVAARFDGSELVPAGPEDATFYRELRPVSSQFVEDAVAVSGLDRSSLAETGADPADAMNDAFAWGQEQVAAGERPVLVAYPLGFDWMFLYWYFVAYCRDGSPFGFSSALDMKTMYQQKAQVVLSRAGKDDLPGSLRSSRAHTHNALDDALEQAEIFVRLFQWRVS
jgi:hypothetical protein